MEMIIQDLWEKDGSHNPCSSVLAINGGFVCFLFSQVSKKMGPPNPNTDRLLFSGMSGRKRRGPGSWW